jgi:hypothetical protein
MFVPLSAATEENRAAIQIETIIDIKNTAFAILAVCNVDQISPSIFFSKIITFSLRYIKIIH